MDNSFMVGLSAQQVLRQRMDMTANNLANMTTTGFKTERLVMRELSERPAAASDLPKDIAFVDAWSLQRDFSNGPLMRTGNALDVAIEGEGFFAIGAAGGEAYTRDGSFSMAQDGSLVTRNGDPVLGEGGAIRLNPEGGPVTVNDNGAIMQDGAEAGRLKVVAFDTPAALEKLGSNLWRATDEAPRAPTQMRVSSGFLEGSNVNPVLELTQMIEISRMYQSVSQAISNADELRGTSIDKLSRFS
ncbi:MAG: flagellar basal-body rod protein FlgF [Hyphomonadaceae bacterium]